MFALMFFWYFNARFVVWCWIFQFRIVYGWWVQLWENERKKMTTLDVTSAPNIFLLNKILPCIACYGIFPMVLDCCCVPMLHQDWKVPIGPNKLHSTHHQLQWQQQAGSTTQGKQWESKNKTYEWLSMKQNQFCVESLRWFRKIFRFSIASRLRMNWIAKQYNCAVWRVV